MIKSFETQVFFAWIVDSAGLGYVCVSNAASYPNCMVRW